MHIYLATTPRFKAKLLMSLTKRPAVDIYECLLVKLYIYLYIYICIYCTILIILKKKNFLPV